MQAINNLEYTEDNMETITNLTDYAAHQVDVKNKANRYDQLQAEHQVEVGNLAHIGGQVVAAEQQAAKKKLLHQAYSVGAQHGADTVVQEMHPGLAQQGVMQDPMNQGGGVTNAEMARAKGLFGDKVDMRDVELMRRLDTLDTSNKPNY